MAETPPMANGTLFLPYLMAERTPWWDPDVKGAFLGLSLKTKRSELFKAVIEGICYNLNIIKDIYQDNYPFQNMRVFGGLAKSDIILQILADITGLELDIPNYLEEATSMGAAVIGGVGVGLFPSFSVIDNFIKITKTIYPDHKNNIIYDKYKYLLELGYYSLQELNQELTKIK
jgi:xylulokinase